jgi:hypothetical protein
MQIFSQYRDWNALKLGGCPYNKQCLKSYWCASRCWHTDFCHMPAGLKLDRGARICSTEQVAAMGTRLSHRLPAQ